MGQTDPELLWESNSVKLLETTIDNQLQLENRISLSCAKANRNYLLLLGFGVISKFSSKNNANKGVTASKRGRNKRLVYTDCRYIFTRINRVA